MILSITGVDPMFISQVGAVVSTMTPSLTAGVDTSLGVCGVVAPLTIRAVTHGTISKCLRLTSFTLSFCFYTFCLFRQLVISMSSF